MSADGSSQTGDVPHTESTDMVQESHFLKLPTEILAQIIIFLPTITLAPVAASSKRLYRVVHSEPHWKERLLAYNLPQTLKVPEPFASWENLFLGHYPYWFLPKHRIWFADGTDTDGGLAGQLIVTQYDHRTGNIMGYALVGAKGRTVGRSWPEKPGVSIHDFHPLVRLHLENPVIRLRPRPGALPGRYDRRTEREPPGLASRRSASSDLNQAHQIDNHIMLAQSIPPELQHDSMRLWPLPRLPAIDRTRQFTPSLWSQSQLPRSDSPSELAGKSFDRPTAHKDVCESVFRMRKKLGGHPARLFELLVGGLDRAGGGVTTWATLPEDAYKPTKERPYEGIWVGDYASHGCEFLLIRQKITKAEKQASEPVRPRMETLLDGQVNLTDQDGVPIVNGDDDDDFHSANEDQEGSDADMDDEDALAPDDEIGETGRLEAIKLTGDANIPRGEFTFVAEEIGRAGQLYVAQSAEFKDKRVVGSYGHIATRGFVDDVFIKADLILVSHNCLAQYWHEFGHVAFYRRVDVESFFNPDEGVHTVQL